jgi:hypothetical protein
VSTRRSLKGIPRWDYLLDWSARDRRNVQEAETSIPPPQESALIRKPTGRC